GFRYVNGHPGEAPVRPNLSLGDTLAALHAVIGVLLALVSRERNNSDGQEVDVAIYESVFNVLEGVVAEYSGAGVVREPSGTTLTGIVPTNTYRCADAKYVVIGGNGDSIFKRLMCAAGRDDLANDPRLADNPGRVANQQEIDAAIGAWTATRTSRNVLAALREADVPCGPIYSVADMFADPHFAARELFESVQVDGQDLQLPAIVPKLSTTPGATDWAGPALGAHNDEVLQGLLGMSQDEVDDLRGDGIV
ncbi:MAG: CoA transferase, partial [Gammaproteobacteria bacterium]|nr:CoA transferase [Gammaproteobacteria bacterium]